MEAPHLHYRPTLDLFEIEVRLGKLLVRGRISDNDIERRIVRIGERFSIYAACSPFGLWAPGLDITREMRLASELYLPLDEVRSAFRRLVSLSLKYAASLTATVFYSSPSWLDVLHRLHLQGREANPARMLRRSLDEGEFRSRLLCSLFLPRHYGGSFDRYPQQTAFLRNWLERNGPSGRIRCLDAACGSGESTYELALLLLECGYDPEKVTVHGITIEPLELFAAAHGWFPHDPPRQAAFRRRIGRLMTGAAVDIAFCREDLTGSSPRTGEGYDIILCNGFLGGPFLNRREALVETIGRLSSQLRPGGIFLAADRFHGGWKRTVPDDTMRGILAGCGLRILYANEGVAGMKR